MWIRGQYSDISRRADLAVGPTSPSAARVLLAFALVMSGCVVTDKIEFEEATNQPFAILSRDPEDNIIQGEKGEVMTLSVLVYDPDFEEVDDVTLAGKLSVESDRWSTTVTYYCPSPVVSERHDGESGDDRIVYLLSCPFNLPEITTAGTLLEFTLEVSDLGFYGSGQPRSGAFVSEVNWVIEML